LEGLARQGPLVKPSFPKTVKERGKIKEEGLKKAPKDQRKIPWEPGDTKGGPGFKRKPFSEKKCKFKKEKTLKGFLGTLT